MTLTHCGANGLVTIRFDAFELPLIAGVFRDGEIQGEATAHIEWRSAAAAAFHAAGLVALLALESRDADSTCADYVKSGIEDVRRDLSA